jgi:hypothetical protein
MNDKIYKDAKTRIPFCETVCVTLYYTNQIRKRTPLLGVTVWDGATAG